MPLRLAAGLVLVALAHGVLAAPQQTPLTFRSTVDLVAVDVQVIDKVGQPVGGLTTKDFEVWINGRPRRVASADLVTYPIVAARRAAMAPGSPAAADPSVAPVVVPKVPRDVTGRVIVLAIDEASLTPGSARQAMKAARQFVDKLAPEDVVGVYAFPFGPAKLDLQHDHAAVARRLDTVTGRFSKPNSGGLINLTIGEIIDIASAGPMGATPATKGAGLMLDAIVARECGVPPMNGCPQAVHMEALTAAVYYETQYQQSLGDLRELLIGLGTVPGRKNVVLISGGLASTDSTGGRPNVQAMIKHAVEVATSSDASLYVVHVDSSMQEAFSAANKPKAQDTVRDSGDSGPGGFLPGTSGFRFGNLSRDSQVWASGLERLAGDAGGAVFRDQVGAGELAFDRILRETSGYYLLGVESTAADRNGRMHYIRVKANAKNATIRARTQVVIPRGKT